MKRFLRPFDAHAPSISLNRPRIFLFIPTSRSGVARFAFELTAALDAAGDIEPILIAPGDFEFSGQLRREVLLLSISPIQGQGAVGKLISMLTQILELARHLRRAKKSARAKPHIHILANYVAPLQLLTHLLVKSGGAAIYYTAHDVSPHHKSGSKTVNNVNHLLFKLIYRLSDFIHVHTEAHRNELIASYEVLAKKVTLIPHGLNLIDLNAAPHKQGVVSKLIVLGSIRSNKKIIETIDAVVQLRSSGYAITLEIFGAGSRLERDYLNQVREKALCAGPGISFAEGFVSEEIFDELLQNCDAVLLPYGDFSSQSGVAMRAIRNGSFIIGTPQCGGDIAIADVLGLSINAGASTLDIKAGIQAYLAVSVAERKRRIEKLRTRVAEKIGWKVVGKSIASWYLSRSGQC